MTGATLANRQQNRLYPEFESISSFDPIGRSRYNGLELTANKRFNRGYSILASYTFSKAKDNTSRSSALQTRSFRRMIGPGRKVRRRLSARRRGCQFAGHPPAAGDRSHHERPTGWARWRR